MAHKKVIHNQKYENYWKITLGTTDIFGNQFIRTLEMIVNHIDKYGLSKKTIDELVTNPESNKKKFNQKVTHAKELQEKIRAIYQNDDPTGASTRKQINQYIKLGFIKPYLQGYRPAAKEYIKPNQSNENLQRLFSDTVYQYAAFNSSQTTDSKFNQVKFLVQTILNRKEKKLTANELIGLMTDTRVLGQSYAKEKDIQADAKWAESIDFNKRKYNQIGYIRNVLSKLSLFNVVGKKYSEMEIRLVDQANKYIPEPGNTKRDSYRFGLMKKAVFEESERLYGKDVCWLTKKESMGLVVSHIYASAEALRNYDNDAAYDPNNALLLLPGNPDQFFDKCKMTFDQNGYPIFNDNDQSSFVSEVTKNQYRIDKAIMNPERCKYMRIHNKWFEEKNHQSI